MAFREGRAEVAIACAPEAAFAWLADPRNADQWFASVGLVEPPERPLRAGGAWRFSMLRQRGRIVPMRLAAYQAPQRFTWETTYPAWRDNLQWSLDLASAPENPAEDAGVDATPRTRLRLTIRQRPGPLGWPALALAALLGQIGAVEGASMAARAERAAERAREALEAAPTLSYGARPRRPSPPRGKPQRQAGKRGRG